MELRDGRKGFTLIEVIVAVALFALFALGIYGATIFIYKIIFRSRLTILETALLSEQLEVARNLPYESIGIEGGVPSGVLPHTQTVTRDGVSFNVVTTVRNIDDPYDGTVGGNPNDLAPADYKLVEMSAICNSCLQRMPLVLSTEVGPKGLEGSSKNGALFIHVFDANGQPVKGANVHVSSPQSTPPVTLDDTTDKDGYLRIVDTPTGTMSYAIAVSKSGYSSDNTVAPSAQVLSPVKPPANVVSQQVTDISFSIDQLANLSAQTLNQACSAVGNVGFNLKGAKLIGRDPDVLKYNQNFTTDGAGNKAIGNMEWDTYDVSLSGSSYDIAGSIPQEPFYLPPGSTQSITLVLKPHSSNSLLVKVQDAATGLPLSGANAKLTAAGYDTTYVTGVGYVRQTDWSWGAGATNFTEGRYFSDDGNLANNSPAGDMILKKSGNYYRSDGWFESATFDFGSAVNFQNVLLNPITQPPQAGSQPLLVQIATSNSSTPSSWIFVGPDGTNQTYYSATGTAIFGGASPKRYLRYRAYLHTDNTKYAPRLSEISFTYTNNCTPPGQAFFDSLGATTYTLQLSATGYAPASTTIAVSGYTNVAVNMAEQ